MLALLWKTVAPDIELVFHLEEETGPVIQPARIDNCSWSRSGVSYLRRLPRGKTSFWTWITSFRPRSSPSSTRHSTRSLGLRPMASQIESGRVVRRFLSIMVEGNGRGTIPLVFKEFKLLIPLPWPCWFPQHGAHDSLVTFAVSSRQAESALCSNPRNGCRGSVIK
jgi:hypothetical protein